MEMPIEVEAKMCADRAKEIFAKEHISDTDVQFGTYFINKWKKLTNWVERTESPIVEPQ